MLYDKVFKDDISSMSEGKHSSDTYVFVYDWYVLQVEG